MSILQIRLQNCLTTLLETEPCLARNFRTHLAVDFAELAGYLDRLESMSLGEEDVARMERLAAAFLRQAALACARSIEPKGRMQ